MTAPHWIDPSALPALFGRRSTLAIVGNSPRLLGAARGTLIDQCDIVVRFNSCVTNGFEVDVGRKLSIYVTTGLSQNDALGLETRCCVENLRCVVAITPFEHLAALVVGHGKLLQVPSLGVPAVSLLATLSNVDRAVTESGGKTHRWTTGSYAIYTLTRLLQPARLLLSGFDLFGVPHPTGHYFRPVGARSRRAEILDAHDPVAEAQMWPELLRRAGAPVFVTADVADAIPTIRGQVQVVSQ